MSSEIHFIDLFAGIGGMRLGLENACKSFNIKSRCVFTSEIKPHAIETYKDNFNESNIYGNISQISTSDIPDFDILLAGFPCQPFSTAGTKNNPISFDVFPSNNLFLKDILQSNQPTLDTPFVKKILSLYSINELHGKAIKDKRGGDNNIHSWDLEIKGEVSQEQKDLLNKLLKERRKKIWAAKKGIVWMDGMPLTLEEILTFFSPNNLFQCYDVQEMLDDLVAKGYLKFEHPKDLVEIVNEYY